MKAVVCERYGPPEVLKFAEIDKPAPKKGEVLVKVMATAVNSADVRLRGLRIEGAMAPLIKTIMRLVVGIRRPRKKVLGVVLAGIVEELGEGVKKFRVGDEVYAATGFALGGYAEYAVVSADKAIALKPKRASFAETAALPFGGSTAMYFLRKAGLSNAKKVLIYGSTGAVGTAAVQLAKIAGAEVAAICGQDGMELSKKLGATKVYDYKKQLAADLPEQYDIIFDAVGKITKKDCTNRLSPDGKFVTVGGYDVSKERASDLEELASYFDDGKFIAVIDRTYPLEDIVEAHHYVDTGHKKGNVVITVSET